MEYKVLRINDNHTATVQMTMGEKTLNQDFDLGESTQDLEDNIRQGFAVFKRDMDAHEEKQAVADDYQELVDVPKVVEEKELSELQDEPFGEVKDE